MKEDLAVKRRDCCKAGERLELSLESVMSKPADQQVQQGVIRSHVDLAEAAATGSRAMVEFLLESGVHIDTPGKDGTTPLCAAALWGNDTMVSYLLDKGADVSARNEGTGWTALHAASFQEHGKVVRILLAHQADPKLVDAEGRKAVDYASISEAIWPFFSAQGCTRSTKSDLVTLNILRKIPDQPEHTQLSDNDVDSIAAFSRPGSSYSRALMNISVKSSSFKDERRFVDPLGDTPPTEHDSNQRPPSLRRIGI